jgi:hypothetical protein
LTAYETMLRVAANHVVAGDKNKIAKQIVNEMISEMRKQKRSAQVQDTNSSYTDSNVNDNAKNIKRPDPSILDDKLNACYAKLKKTHPDFSDDQIGRVCQTVIQESDNTTPSDDTKSGVVKSASSSVPGWLIATGLAEPGDEIPNTSSTPTNLKSAATNYNYNKLLSRDITDVVMDRHNSNYQRSEEKRLKQAAVKNSEIPGWAQVAGGI